MKRILSFAFAFAFISSAFAACTMDFNQFKPGGGGSSGSSGAAGTSGASGTSGSAGSGCTAECCLATDCTAPSDPCKQATCIANVCGEEALADGTATGTQTTGDCKKSVCQTGTVAIVDDDSDTVDDGNDCTADSCMGGMAQSAPETMGKACNSAGGKLCDGQGKCVECLQKSDCADTLECAGNTCVPATCNDSTQNGDESDTDCGGGMCPPCDTGDGCKDDGDCQSSVCGNNDKCSAPDCNDNTTNGNETGEDCGGGMCNPCDNGEGCKAGADCKSGVCDGNQKCAVPTCSDSTKNGNETDTDCGGNGCPGCDVGQTCNGDDGNCKDPLYCGPGNKCTTPIVDGQMCSDSSQCASTHCAQGVCCATSCFGPCVSCNLGGSAGTCTNIPAGTDPKNLCNGNTPVCDGNGACGKSPTGTTCGGAGECASGFCVDTVCCDVACTGTCQACSAGKNGGADGTCGNVPANQDPDNECPGMKSCDGNGVCMP